jgi:hypothetical protein
VQRRYEGDDGTARHARAASAWLTSGVALSLSRPRHCSQHALYLSLSRPRDRILLFWAALLVLW